LELISIEDWIKLIERMQIASQNISFIRKGRLLTARTDIATGIMECGDCGCRYYFKEQKSYTQTKKKEYRYVYYSYYHYAMVKRPVCNQKPLSFKIKDIDEIFKIFYFYFYIVFDNKNDLIKESQRNIKQTQVKLKEKIVKIEKEIRAIEGRLERFQKSLDRHETDDLTDTILYQIKHASDKLNEQNIELSKDRIELELQNDRYNKNELELSYYDVKERVLDWFNNMSIEEQRNELIRTITSAKIYGRYLIIEAGKIVFLFDIRKHERFDISLLDNLDKDKVYKKYFTELENKKEVRKHNDKLIPNVNLELDNMIKIRVFEYLVQKYGIAYDFVGKTNLISFVPLTGLYSIELKEIKK
jgi:hypothetical protein